MKTEHEILKEICDEIGYNVDWEYYKWRFARLNVYWSDYIWTNLREIIFTQEFMDKYQEYYWVTYMYMWERLNKHLDNPTEYLYNLLK